MTATPERFAMSDELVARIRSGNGRAATSIDGIYDPARDFTFVTPQPAPTVGNEVLRRGVAFWKMGEHVNDRWLIDKTGRRSHLFYGNAKAGGIGFSALHLPGTAGNYASAPHAQRLAMTGDVDLQVRVAPDTWAAGVEQALIAKWDSATNNKAYKLVLSPAGALVFTWSEDGVAELGGVGAVIPDVDDGAYLWVRATLEVNDGAGQSHVRLYTSQDDAIWTLFATLDSSPTIVFPGEADVEIGVADGTSPLSGTITRAQIYRGLDGTLPVLDADFTGRPEGTTGFIDKARWLLTDGGLNLDGITNEHATSTYASTFNLSDADIRLRVSLIDWHDDDRQVLVARWTNTEKSYELSVINGELAWRWSVNGTTPIEVASTGWSAYVDDADLVWVRVTHDIDNGASGNVVTFWVSPDGADWTALSAVTSSGTTSIHSSMLNLVVGTDGDGLNGMSGDVQYLEIRNGINGTIVAQPRFVEAANQAFVFTDDVSRPWTISDVRNTISITQASAAGEEPARVETPTANRGLLMGAGAHLETQDGDAFNVLAGEDFSVGVNIKYDTWPVPADEVVISMRDTFVGSTAGWQIVARTDGTYAFRVSDGTTNATATITGGTGDDVLVATRDAGNVIQIYRNGVAGTSAADPPGDIANSLPVTIGELSGGGMEGTFRFRGGAFWDELLTADDIDLLLSQMRA